MAEFNISDLYRQAFGYQMPENHFEIPQNSERIEKSTLGSSYYKDDLYGREMFMPVLLKGYLLPFAVLSISCKKTIVETALVERAGTVKEIITTDDYVINVKGIVIRPDNNFPDTEVIDLNELFKFNESIEMQSVLTDIFLSDDHKVVIKSIAFPTIAGVQNARAYEIDLVSDNIYKLEM